MCQRCTVVVNLRGGHTCYYVFGVFFNLYHTCSKILPVFLKHMAMFFWHHGTLFKRIYNNNSPGLFSSSYVLSKLVEVFFFQYVCMYVCVCVRACVCVFRIVCENLIMLNNMFSINNYVFLHLLTPCFMLFLFVCLWIGFLFVLFCFVCFCFCS